MQDCVLWLVAGLAAGVLDYAFAAGFGLVASLVLSAGLNVDPRAVAGAAAFAQLTTAPLALAAHRRAGNLSHVDSRQARGLVVVSLSAAVGALAASLIASHLAAHVVGGLVYPVMLIALGLTTLHLLAVDHKSASSLAGYLLGFTAGVFKAIVGGGYSLLLVAAMNNLGLELRNSIALTPLTKLPAFTIVAVAYMAAGHTNPLEALALTSGALASAPLAAHLLRRLGGRGVRLALSLTVAAAGVLRLLASLA